MYRSQIEKNCDVVFTGLKGPKNRVIIDSVLGQLSDGMWENSPRMEGYWRFCVTSMHENEVTLLISNEWAEWNYDRYKNNAFKGKSISQIRTWFAHKLKEIVKQEEKDWPSSGIKWDRKCLAELEYFNSYDNKHLTVQDIYKAYDILLGRGDIYWFGK